MLVGNQGTVSIGEVRQWRRRRQSPIIQFLTKSMLSLTLFVVGLSLGLWIVVWMTS